MAHIDLILLAIWKSRHRHLGIAIVKNLFLLFWKKNPTYVQTRQYSFFFLGISPNLLFLSLEYSFLNCNKLWMNFKPHWPAELHTRSHHQLQIKQQHVIKIRKFTDKIVSAYKVEKDLEKYFEWKAKLSHFKTFFWFAYSLIYSVLKMYVYVNKINVFVNLSCQYLFYNWKIVICTDQLQYLLNFT